MTTGTESGSVQVEALKPCPFCGCTQCGLIPDGDEDGPMHYGYCPACNTEGPVADSTALKKAVESDAVDRWNRRAALPVAPSDEPHPPSRHCMCAACRPSFDDDAPLPVAALSDADRELMEQAAEALDLVLDESVGDGTVRHRISAEMAYAAEQVIAALRTRILRHSEGKAG